jgi:inorganic pyrophosphatase
MKPAVRVEARSFAALRIADGVGVTEEAGVLDALVLTYEPTFPGCVIPARPIGILDMRDEKGQDSKILAVPMGDPRFDGVTDLHHLAPHWLAEIENFFAIYKTLEGTTTEVTGWRDAKAAREVIMACQQRGERGV